MRSLLVVTLAAALATPLLAQSNEISLLGGISTVGSTESDGSSVDFDNGTAFGIAYNRYWTPRFSTDFSAMRSSHDGSLRFAGEPLLDTGSLELTTIAATAQFHFIRAGSLDVYAGAGVANVNADDLESDDLRLAGIPSVSVESQTTWLANAGAGFEIGRSFEIGVDGKYVRYRPDSASPGGEPVRLDLDPLIVSVALKFRF